MNLVLGTLGLLCLGLGACASRSPDHGAASMSLRVEKSSLAYRVRARGMLESVTITPFSAPSVEVNGLTIVNIVPNGTEVKKGAVFVEFDPIDVTHKLEEDRSELEIVRKKIAKAEVANRAERNDIALELRKARLNLDKAEAALKRLHPSLFSRQVIVKAEIDRDLALDHVHAVEEKAVAVEASGETELEMLRIEEKQLLERIEETGEKLDSLKLSAPCDGIVIHDYRQGYKPGDVIWRGQDFGKIHQPDALKVKAYVLEQDAGALKVGQKAEVRIDAFPERAYEGEVEIIDNVARPRNRVRRDPVKYFEVTVKLAEMDLDRMKPGMPVSALILAADLENVITVPVYAVFEAEGSSFVYLLNGGEPERRTVQLGMRSKARAVVTEGLSVGDTVAVRNPYLSYADFAADKDRRRQGSGGEGRP